MNRFFIHFSNIEKIRSFYMIYDVLFLNLNKRYSI